MNSSVNTANYCTYHYLKQTKMKYFDKISFKKLTEDKSFSRTIKAFFLEKIKTSMQSINQSIN